MWRLCATLTLAVLLAAGCAKKPLVAGASSAPSSTRTPNAVPFTDRELADTLRQQTRSAAASGRATSATSKDSVPEIQETPRGVVITLPQTYFEFDSFDLDARARRIVERIAYVLNHPRAADRSVVLEGHADAIGTDEYNLSLSRHRAETVARELVGQAVRRERVTVEAYGESRPAAPNQKRDGTDDPSGRAKNRRVEAVIRR